MGNQYSQLETPKERQILVRSCRRHNGVYLIRSLHYRYTFKSPLCINKIYSIEVLGDAEIILAEEVSTITLSNVVFIRSYSEFLDCPYRVFKSKHRRHYIYPGNDNFQPRLNAKYNLTVYDTSVNWDDYKLYVIIDATNT